MIKNLLAATAVIALTAPAFANPLTKDELNTLINNTNFVVAKQCSGTLISLKYRLVLTNDHCLEGFVDKVEKEEVGKDGSIEKKTREVYKDMPLVQKVYKNFEEVSSSEFQAKILFHSAKYDLALLQIKADSIPQKIYAHVLPDTVKVHRGDAVYVVGNPYMLDANLNEGHISSTNRSIHWDETNEDVHYYGVDAGVNPGNSGGSLYDEAGNLIGVPGAGIPRATGLGFAIPAETIRAFLSDHCYSDVWNTDPSVKDHDACEKEKLDKVNEIRAKVGLPPLDKPKEQERLDGPGTIAHATHLDVEKQAPATATKAPPVQSPVDAAPIGHKWSLINWLDSFGIELR